MDAVPFPLTIQVSAEWKEDDIYIILFEPILMNSHRNYYKRGHSQVSLELHFLLFPAAVGSVLNVAQSVLLLN